MRLLDTILLHQHLKLKSHKVILFLLCFKIQEVLPPRFKLKLWNVVPLAAKFAPFIKSIKTRCHLSLCDSSLCILWLVRNVHSTFSQHKLFFKCALQIHLY